MTKVNKIEVVKTLTNKYKENNIFYLLDASRLNNIEQSYTLSIASMK